MNLDFHMKFYSPPDFMTMLFRFMLVIRRLELTGPLTSSTDNIFRVIGSCQYSTDFNGPSSVKLPKAEKFKSL